MRTQTKAMKITRWSGMGKPFGEEIEAVLKKEGFETFAWIDGPGTRYGSHRHSYEEGVAKSNHKREPLIGRSEEEEA